MDADALKELFEGVSSVILGALWSIVKFLVKLVFLLPALSSQLTFHEWIPSARLETVTFVTVLFVALMFCAKTELSIERLQFKFRSKLSMAVKLNVIVDDDALKMCGG